MGEQQLHIASEASALRVAEIQLSSFRITRPSATLRCPWPEDSWPHRKQPITLFFSKPLKFVGDERPRTYE